MLDLIVSVPDHCLSFYFSNKVIGIINSENFFFFSKFIDTSSTKFQNVGLKSLLKQDLSETEIYDDLLYKFRKTVG